MKRLTNFMSLLIFLLVLVVLFWMMPNNKIETIGVFFEKIMTPLALAVSAGLGLKEIKRNYYGKKDKSP
ncbi:hypothetical protein [Aestuariibaculum sediminum]|uniref:Uncharacterized protein n=1 Tax=Aestuariibaculum sediminum TaxID=2770637 RepID=A0A8J6UI29_9FLAO|nr:hypothetical protein [Aestuariibaculum sediminum]MBD0833731.1 hypothetical protein [Aestuariibaculum sediminum]